MNFEQKLSFTDYRNTTGDHFLEKLSERMNQERIERRRTYINVALLVVCGCLIVLNFIV